MKSKGSCPTCTKPSSEAHAPFCSKRCADVDLHRWLQGSYAIPAIELDDVEDTDMDGLDGHSEN